MFRATRQCERQRFRLCESRCRGDLNYYELAQPTRFTHAEHLMNITVILCTYNRCASLPRALASVAASELPSAVKWEVLVVDNNSTDETRAVLEEFCHLHPGRVRYLLERRQGLSQARNAGIREARG